MERKGKEYDNFGNHSFEGEYLNGKKWKGKIYKGFNNTIYELKEGKGFVKQYIIYDIIFEGEYLDGERYKGKKETDNGDLIFEGEFLNYKKWNGKGKEYYIGNKLLFEGEYKNGKRNGKAKNFFMMMEK